jgi:hypothetical protein
VCVDGGAGAAPLADRIVLLRGCWPATHAHLVALAVVSIDLAADSVRADLAHVQTVEGLRPAGGLLFVKISINIESGEQKTILKKVMAAM